MYPDECDCTKGRICRHMRREREVAKTTGNGTQMIAAEQGLGRSRTTSNTVLRAELRVYPLKTNRGVES